jgi:polyphosphate kinase
MHRNIYERVEVMFHLRNPALSDQVLREVVAPYMADTEKTRYLQPDGSYLGSRDGAAASRRRKAFGFNAQEYLLGFTEGAAPMPAFPGLASLRKLHTSKKPAERPA